MEFNSYITTESDLNNSYALFNTARLWMEKEERKKNFIR